MHDVRSIEVLLSQISRGEILLPEFQRGYVWNRNQVRELMQSLYRKHPTGHLLIWRTYKPSRVRGAPVSGDSYSRLLLDGQQRLTTLYVIFNGEAPQFYEGESLFFDLFFNVQTEEFRFWQKSRMAKNPAWIGVHEFLRETLHGLLQRMQQLDSDNQEMISANLAQLSKLDSIRNYTYTVDQVSGDEFTVDEVVKIFNRVNSKGTPLKKSDLALAHICSIWPEARAEMREFQAKMAQLGFKMDFTFLVRCLAGVATGSVLLEGSFLKTSAKALQTAWQEMKPAFEHLVGILRHEAFIGGLSDLPTPNVLIPATVFLARQGGEFPTDAVKNRFIRWLYLAGLWARYSGATETKLQQDLALVTGNDLDPTHELETAILRERGRVILEASDLIEIGINSAAARLSHVAARARGARDWFTGIRIYDKVTGHSHASERHYIFSLSVLKKEGFDSNRDRKINNELANRAFLTQKATREVRSSPPAVYLPCIAENQPGALRAQSVPMDRKLWNPQNYRDFLDARRNLLARAMNEFIASWIPKEEVGGADEQGVRRMMASGENATVEFKSTLRWGRRQEHVNKALEKVVIKTLAGFLNADGGTLLIGVDDAGVPIGIADDYNTLKKSSRDGFELHLRNLITRDLGDTSGVYVNVTFHEIDAKDICQVSVEPSDFPVYVDDKKEAVFYLRTGNATRPLSVKEAIKYIPNHWSQISS